MDIGRQLRNLLDQERISQKELAKALNISDSTLSGYVKNRRQPDAKTVIRIASYFHTTTDYIYGLTSVRDPITIPYNAEERHLVNIYRAIPEDKRPLYIETGRVFSLYGKNKKKKDKTEAEEIMVKMISSSYDISDKKYIEPILQYLKK